MSVLRDRPVNTHLRPRKTPAVPCKVPHRPNAASLAGLCPSSRPQICTPRPRPPTVVISPPPAAAVELLTMSSSPPHALPTATACESPGASPSSIPLPQGLKPRPRYPTRRDYSPSSEPSAAGPTRRHSNNACPRLLRYPSTGSPSSADDPTPQNFSRPHISHSHPRAVTNRDLHTNSSSGRIAPRFRTAVVGKTERPRVVHNKASTSAHMTPAPSPTFEAANGKTFQFSSHPDRSRQSSDSSPPLSHASFSEHEASAVEMKPPNAAARAQNDSGRSGCTPISISEELTSKFNRHLYRPPRPVRFASSLPSIPSQKTLGFTRRRSDRSLDSDSDGSSFGLQIPDRRSPRYTLTRSPSPLSSSSDSDSGHCPAAIADKPRQRPRVPSIGFPSNPTGRARRGGTIQPPEVPRQRTPPSSNSPSATRGSFSLATASTTAKKIPSPDLGPSRSSKVIDKLSGLFSSTRRSSAEVPTTHPRVARGDRSTSRPGPPRDVHSMHNSHPSESPDVHDTMLRDLARVKTLVQLLKSKADEEADATTELSLRQTAQILQETLICAVEARISATRADEEAEKARVNCEMAAKSVERLLRAS